MKNSVCHYFIEDFCMNVHQGDWPIVLLFGGLFVCFGDECNTGFINELDSVPSLSISWNSLRRVDISSSLKLE
jgi:hypothetical protein